MSFTKIFNVSSSEFFRGSLILLVLVNIGNVLNYVYQIAMARMLGPGDYGILAVLMSLTYIFAIPTLAIQTGIAKKISRLNLEKDYGKMKGLFFYFLKKLFIISFFIFVIFSLLSLLIAKALSVPFWLLFLTGTLIIASFIYPVASGSLQGLKKFSGLGWNIILIFSIKLIIAVLLVSAGFKIYGAILGFTLSIFFGFILALPLLKKIMRAESVMSGVQIFTKENILIFTAMLIFVFIYSIDVILAKVFFSNETVGKYAVVSMIGKIILFSTMSIGNAFFPISAERHHAGIRTENLMKKAMLSILAVCSIAVVILSVFSEQIIKLLFGVQYLSLANLLLPISATFSFIAFFNLLLLYKISTDELNFHNLTFIVLFLIIQIFLLSLFSSSIEKFAIAFMFSSIVTFIGTLIFVRKWKK